MTPLDEALETVRQKQEFQVADEEKFARLNKDAPDLVELVREERLSINGAIAALEVREQTIREIRDRGRRAVEHIVERFVEAVAAIMEANKTGSKLVIEPDRLDQLATSYSRLMKEHDR